MAEIPLTMTPSTLTYSPPNLDTNMKVSINQMLGGTKGVSQFPPQWKPQSGDPGIRVVVTNNSSTATIAPVIVDAYTDNGTTPATTQYAILAELSTVQPGQTVNEVIQALPVTQMYLCCWYLCIGAAEVTSGFTVTVQAFAR